VEQVDEKLLNQLSTKPNNTFVQNTGIKLKPSEFNSPTMLFVPILDVNTTTCAQFQSSALMAPQVFAVSLQITFLIDVFSSWDVFNF